MKELRKILWIENDKGGLSKYRLISPKEKKPKPQKTPVKKTTAKKATPKKAPAKKATAKKTPAKKAPAKKAAAKKKTPKKGNNVAKPTEAAKNVAIRPECKVVLQKLTKEQLDEMTKSNNRKPLKTSIEKKNLLNVTRHEGMCVFFFQSHSGINRNYRACF